MIAGDPNSFAIESEITTAYERLSLRGLGFFVIHVGGNAYGVKKPDATMLANSFDEVARRIKSSGEHTAPFASEPAEKIADAVCRFRYEDLPNDERLLGVTRGKFAEVLDKHHVLWAPDGDEAFDDGSHILHFDVDNQVRLIAFVRFPSGNIETRDQWLETSKFYAILARWHDHFLAVWTQMPKKLEFEEANRIAFPLMR